MRRNRRRLLAVALGTVLSLTAAACSSGNDSAKSTTSTSAVRRGGTITIGAEQRFDCTDWISSTCGGLTWATYAMQQHTVPRVFDYVKERGRWVYRHNILLTGEPTLSQVNGKQTVTYRINPKAVWSDGQPITSSDFKYTWEQIKNGSDIYDKTGYNEIESVDDSNPRVAVVTFGAPFAAWRQDFGSMYGILPSHLLAGKDRAAEMGNGYSWSGGPWVASFNADNGVTLTPNPRWYGTKPRLDKVVFKWVTQTSSEFRAVADNEVQAIYPQPDSMAPLQGDLGNTNLRATADTANIEALWVNNAKPPFDSVKVRQAFAYALDRDAIVARLFGTVGVRKAMQTMNPPILAPYADTSAYARYRRNLRRVDSLMKSDGWAKGADGVWAKNGQRAAITLQTTTGIQRRELAVQIVQDQLKSAGFDVSIQNHEIQDLGGSILPNGDFQVVLLALQATSLEPNLCPSFCSKNIPGPANDNSGLNVTRTSIPALDTLLQTVDTNTDEGARRTASKRADVIMADQMVTLPLDPLPNIMVWSKRIVGPISDNPILGMFWNLDQWGVRA